MNKEELPISSTNYYGLIIQFKSYDNLKEIVHFCDNSPKNTIKKDVVLSIGHLDFELSWEKFLEAFGLRPKEIRELLK